MKTGQWDQDYRQAGGLGASVSIVAGKWSDRPVQEVQGAAGQETEAGMGHIAARLV